MSFVRLYIIKIIARSTGTLTMFICYNIQNNTLNLLSEDELKNGTKPIWIDVSDPTPEEIDFIKNFLNINISKNNEVLPVKLNNFYYRNKGEISVKINILTDCAGIQSITIILTKDMLVTVRPAAVYSIKDYLEYNITNNCEDLTPTRLYMYGLEGRTNRIDVNLKKIDTALDEISKAVFYSQDYTKKEEKEKEIDLKEYINHIGQNGYLISSYHESLISIHQALKFIKKSKLFILPEIELEAINDLIDGISSLEEQISFLSDKLNFLLSICLGMLGIEQNLINKVLSVAALVFLPPAIFASIYGMNFEFMPELKWAYGYPYGLFIIFISGTLPYLFCKFKKWL